MPHLLGISGSLRAGAYNTALLHACSELLPPATTLEITTLAEVPLYNEDVRAAGVIIATPEYN